MMNVNRKREKHLGNENAKAEVQVIGLDVMRESGGGAQAQTTNLKRHKFAQSL